MTNMWMVRAGPNSFLIDEFLQKNLVAIGWNLGDLTDKSDDEIINLYKNKYGDTNSVNQVLRFKNDIQVNDYVITSDNHTKKVYLGRISSDYYHSQKITKTDSADDNYFDVRDVEWLCDIDKNLLKKSTHGTLGSIPTVISIKKEVKEDILNIFSEISSDNLENCSVRTIKNYLSKNNLKLEMGENDSILFSKFKKLYSPEVLKSLEGVDVLNTIFPQKGNKSNLCYALEFSNEFKWLCGGIRGGSAFKFSLFKYSETNKWTVGSAKSNLKSLSDSKAVEVAVKIRDAIVEGANYIKNNNLSSVDDYILLEEELKRIFAESHKYCPINPLHSWIHKYYAIIFPDKIPIVHSDKMKKEMLQKFRIEPETGFYANDGQLYELANKAGIDLYLLFNEEIVRLFFDSENIWAPIEEGKLVELRNCDKISEPFEINLKRNIIYFGAPGTGKSYNLNQDKNILLKDYPDNYERVTFHPDYSYANFVGTYKPVPENKSITYKYVPGPFMRVLKKAIESPNEPYLLIIEEINRANVAAVFGDVFQLLDRDENNESEYDIETSQDMRRYLKKDKIKLPANLFIWATMNSADQGVFPMDTAFKRRWDFKYFSINHDEDLIKNTKTTINGIEINWNTLRKAINYELLSYKINEDKLMGPFFAFNEFMNETIDEEIFKDIFKNKIIMYLFEDAARSRRNELFSGVGRTNVTYSQICEMFDEKGIEIFTDSIKDKFINVEDDLDV